ncbi:MAG TPA: A24 family peptidase [Brevundimonas sp.]
MVLPILLALFGLIVGSFIAAVSVRLPRDEGFVTGRSRCMSCEKPLKAWHLVPVLSWLALRGRCGHCGARIAWRYPVIEITAALIGLWAALHGASWLMVGATAVLGWQLLLIAIIDGENFWLPDGLTLPLIATGLAASWLIGLEPLLNAVIGAVAGFATLWLIGWLYKRVRGREGLGGGDPFLFAGAGAWVGWMGLPSVLLWASAAAFSVVAARLLMRRSVAGTDRLPLGVFLAIGVWMTWLYGPLGL